MSSFRSTPFTYVFRLFAILSAVIGAACGGITLQQAATNDPVPTGTIVAQGSLSGVNGRAVTGTVTVYQQLSSASTCTYTVRLQNLSAPSDPGLQIIPVVNGAQTNPTFYPLRASTGNQNYNFSNGSCAAAFAQVEISNPGISPPSAQNYGIATLMPP